MQYSTNSNNLIITAEESNVRIDALLSSNIDGMSRNAAQNLLESGNVLLNGLPVKKNYRVHEGDEFLVRLPEIQDVDLIPEDIPLDIVYEDEDLIVVNKQRGLVVHPAPGHESGTLVNALMFHCGDSLSGIGGEKRPGIVHRIDKDTSGLIIAAKNDFAHRKLAQQLSGHTLSREYEAIVRGNMKEDSGTVNKPIGRSEKDRKKMAVTEKNSREAVTHWQVIARYKGYTHIRCILETGRTHQIRVHMASTGHPLLGDGTYGSPSPEKGLEGQCLHARRIKFIHPRTGDLIQLETELPEYFINVINKLGEKTE